MKRKFKVGDKKERRNEYMRKYMKKYKKKYYEEKMKEVWKEFSEKCKICNGKSRRGRLILHEIHGKNHPKSNDINEFVDYILKHKNDFVPLCRGCHAKLHWFLRHNRDLVIKLLERSN
jgi:predicted HNH restriction endonuclease